jgi:hypothetical protein
MNKDTRGAIMGKMEKNRRSFVGRQPILVEGSVGNDDETQFLC